MATATVQYPYLTYEEAAVVNQIINTRARLIELERKIREQDVLEERLEALEGVLKVRRTG